MESNITKKSSTPPNEDSYQKIVEEILINLKKKYTYIDISFKILHYLDKPTFCYYCRLLQIKKFNPFDIDILFCIEFINGEIPYATILTDFIEPSLNDNKNYYRCLTKEHKYIFSLDKFKEHEKILESIINNGITTFLKFLDDSIKLNAFIFFGEYEYNHIYQINDFLKNKNNLNFYRINEILSENRRRERYILFTKLYFLLFKPLEKDKNLIKLMFFEKLKDMYLLMDKNDIYNSLVLKLPTNLVDYSLEFVLIDRSRKEIKEEYRTEDTNTNVKNHDKNKVKNKDKTDELKEKIKLSYSILLKEWFTYIDNINFAKYDIVIDLYQMLFNEYRGTLKIKEEDKKQITNFNQLILFYEKIITYYEKQNNKNDKERLQKIISNIIYICSELINCGKSLKRNENEYLIKVKKYLNKFI